MKRFRLEIPGCWLVVNDRVCTIGFRLRGDAARRYRDVHFTIPLNATRRFRPHATLIERDGTSSREDFADLPFDCFIEHMGVVERDLVLAWRCSLEPVELAALDDEGYVLFLPEEATLLALVERHVRFRCSEYGLKLGRLPDLAFELDMIDYVFDHLYRIPGLDPADAAAQPLVAVRLGDGGISDAHWLTYLAASPVIGAGPGWYMVPFDTMSCEVVFRVLAERGGSALLDIIERMGALVGAAPSERWVELRARAGR